jgi:integrase
MNTSFFLRSTKRGESVLYARIYSSRTDYVDFSLGLCTAQIEDYKTQQRIKVVNEKLQEIISDSIKQGIASAQIIRDLYFKQTDSAVLTMKELFNRWIRHQQNRVKWNEIKIVTFKRHLATQAHLEQFFGKPRMNVPVSMVNIEWLRTLESYLKDKVGVNTTLTHIKHVRRAVLYAVENEWISKYPFSSYKAKWKTVDRGYLTREQLERLCNWTTPIRRLSQVKDVFVFQCFTGVSYSDLANMVFDEKKETISGIRNKTGHKYIVPILPQARDILEYYNYKLPVVSNQKMNAYLQEIAGILGIEEHLTTHLARHTFATTFLLENQIPLEVVAKILGHNSVRSTEIYGRVLKSQVLAATKTLKDK